MATLKDVARLASVDVSTVSRALNNTSYVHPETKKRIYAAAKELGYHPNAMAQALRQGRRHAIGVIVPRLHLTIFSEIVQGIDQKARQLGYAALICNTEENPRTERDCLNRLRNGFVDGIIIAGTGRNGRLLRDMQASGIATVQLVREQDTMFSSVVADYEACGYSAVHYLYQQGCREIGLINGALHLTPYRGRRDGYLKAIRELSLSEHFSESNHAANTFEYGFECTNQLLDAVPRLDGILAALDIQGLAAIRALTERGIRIPERVKLISLTGHAVGGMLETPMTSMEMPAHEMGERAAQMIIEEIEAPNDKKPSVRRLIFPASLVVRESA